MPQIVPCRRSERSVLGYALAESRQQSRLRFRWPNQRAAVAQQFGTTAKQ